MMYSDEPSVDSKDKHERIIARRIRIANRRENAKLKQKEYSQLNDNEAEMQEEMDNLLKQIKQSKLMLQKIKLDGFEMIGKIKTDIDAQEIKRRLQEEEIQIKRKDNLSNDKEVTLDKFEEISNKWSLATKEDNAYKLKDLLDKQKEACDSLLQSKDTLLEELKNILKEKDKLYVDELKRQNDDITQISIQMNNQIDLLKTSYKNQLTKIEDIFVKEMSGMSSNMDERWNRLLKERVFKETEYAKNRDIQMEIYEQKLNEQRVKDAEEYNRVKIKLERNIEALQLQIQEMQVTHQMNQEKLEYNYQVLRRRDEENIIMKGLQKKKIKRLQEILLSLNRKAVVNEESLKNSYTKYVDDYTTLVESFKNLLERTKSNFGARNQKYKAVWAMNEDECRRMAGRILDINMVLYEQQLCLPWNSPDIPFLNDERSVDERIISFKKEIEKNKQNATEDELIEKENTPNETSIKSEKTANKELKRKSTRRTSKLYSKSLKNEELIKLKKDLELNVNNNEKSKRPVFINEVSVFGEVYEAFYDQNEKKKEKIQFEEDYFYEKIVKVDECLDVVPPKLIKHIFELICDETGFLVEEKIWSMLNELSPNDQTLMKLDSVLSVMQIEEEEDIKILSKYFLRKGTKYKILENEREDERPFEVEGLDINEVQNPYPTEQEINQMVKRQAPKVKKEEEVVEEGEYASFLIKPNEVLLGFKAFVEENVKQEKCQDKKKPLKSYISTDPGTLTNNLQEMMAVLPKPSLEDILLKNNLYDMYTETELKYQKQDSILDDDYWKRYAEINTPYQKIWDALETCFYKYYKLLIDRVKLIEKKDNLLMQNLEYRKYLETCRKNSEKLPEI